MPVKHILSFAMDTCVTVKKSRGKWVIDEDPNDQCESFEFLKIVNNSGAKYKVLDIAGPGGGWPFIEYTGTKEQLLPIIACLDANGRDEEELAELLEDWDGDNDELYEIIC